jgi:hypothetical protein
VGGVPGDGDDDECVRAHDGTGWRVAVG